MNGGTKKDSNGRAAAAAAAAVSNIYSWPFGLVMYTAPRIIFVLVLWQACMILLFRIHCVL